MNFRFDQVFRLAEVGDSWSIPENIEHEVNIMEDSVLMELLSPIRPDYLP
jgi:hypothetical protein